MYPNNVGSNICDEALHVEQNSVNFKVISGRYVKRELTSSPGGNLTEMYQLFNSASQTDWEIDEVHRLPLSPHYARWCCLIWQANFATSPINGSPYRFNVLRTRYMEYAELTWNVIYYCRSVSSKVIARRRSSKELSWDKRFALIMLGWAVGMVSR